MKNNGKINDKIKTQGRASKQIFPSEVEFGLLHTDFC